MDAKKLLAIAFILTAIPLPSAVYYGLNPYMGTPPSVVLILFFSTVLTAATYFAKPEDTDRIRQMTMGSALILGYGLSVYGSQLGFSMGMNTLTVVILSPFVIANLEDWRIRYAGYGLAGILGIYISLALNQQIVQEVTF